jgi:integrase
MFESILAKEMTAFLELRNSSVCQQTYKHDKTMLIALDQHLTKQDYHKKELSEEILDTWILTLSGKSKTVKEKILPIRNFIKYINEMGNHSFLPDVPRVKSDYIPYIYSDAELLLLTHFADNLEIKMPKACSPYLHAKIPMILRILYGCGTRIGETLALRRKDIDFKIHTISLRKAKFSKERCIPVHGTLMSILERYCLTLGIMLSPEAYLFPGDNHKQDCHFTSRQVAYWFSELLRLANIDQRKKTRGERGASIHCLRHVFVLKSMQQLEAAGHPVDLNDLLLPTYLGHESLLDTDKYMRFSGAQIPEALEAFEVFAAGLIPKVEAPYEDE